MVDFAVYFWQKRGRKKFTVHSVTVAITEIHCHTFLAKLTFLLRKLLKSWFRKIFFQWDKSKFPLFLQKTVEVKFRNFPTMWHTQWGNCCDLVPHNFWQTFRESNVFTIEITIELIWRNIRLVRLIFYGSVAQCKNEKFTLTKETFSEINSLGNNFFLVKTLFSRNFCQ